MGKPKKALQPETPHKNPLKSVKDGQVKKQKLQKFKQTPTGKVPLLNGNSKANGVQKGNKKPQLPNKNQKPVKKPVTPKKGKAQVKKQESDDEEDINEGISITEDVSVNEGDDSDASSEEETPNLLGESLANDSDEDDEDFEATDEEEDEGVKKGVKMFKGSKKIAKSSEDEDDDEDEDDEDEEDEDDEDDEDEEEEKKMQIPVKKAKAQPAKPKKEDKKKEEKPKKATKPVKKQVEKEETDEDEDDDDDEDGDVSKNTTLNSSAKSEEDSDEDDDDEDEDEDEDEEDEGPGLKALLGDSLVDQDDDEDFDVSGEDDEDEEDEDISGEENDTSRESAASDKNQSNDSARFTLSDGEKTTLSAEEKAERDRRTIYLGNVPKELTEKELRKTFKQYGPIESLRVRGIVPENSKMPLKEAAIRKKFHHQSKTLCVYVVYKNADSVEKALEVNGQKLGGNYIRVDRIGQPKPADPKKSVFLGNLPFGVEDNDLWELFGQCGKIDYVRTIRDRSTGCCRGVGYINYFDEDSATLALDLNGKKILGREVRVARYDPNRSQSPKKHNKQSKKRPFPGKSQGSPKKVKTDVEIATHNSVNAEKRKMKKEKSFQGQKAEGKKFKKPGVVDKKKKTIAAKLLSKPKKAQ